MSITLRAARKAANLTQTQLAIMAGCATNVVQRVEYGQRSWYNLKLQTALRISAALGCTVVDIDDPDTCTVDVRLPDDFREPYKKLNNA